MIKDIGIEGLNKAPIKLDMYKNKLLAAGLESSSSLHLFIAIKDAIERSKDSVIVGQGTMQ
jgi:hypothetical protein